MRAFAVPMLYDHFEPFCYEFELQVVWGNKVYIFVRQYQGKGVELSFYAFAFVFFLVSFDSKQRGSTLCFRQGDFLTLLIHFLELYDVLCWVWDHHLFQIWNLYHSINLMFFLGPLINKDLHNFFIYGQQFNHSLPIAPLIRSHCFFKWVEWFLAHFSAISKFFKYFLSLDECLNLI